MILAIETSTPVCSVALGKQGSIIEKRIEGRGVHSERTFTFTKELLDRYNIEVKDLDAILFSKGPGSYTGLRIGAAAIKGLLFGQSIPLFTLSSLVSFSVPYLEQHKPIHAVIDARREHLYHQKIELLSSGDLQITSPVVKELSTLRSDLNRDEIIVGTGWERLQLASEDDYKMVGTEGVSAKNLIMAWNNTITKPLFKQQDVETFEPEYLTMAQVNNSAIRE
ncbi:MAG: tRNA (adenosine(37)-N6)-threonylcarbamoyltransferase complex dimerization subunit type 1 TsaB [Balneolaceae bacterium]|nr:tRNA (adenosine(37)-N6)-threonylcarbamoyltransferase complex dimerization subunit type 1 TsaB [Balneolaceae bacterium]